MTQTYSYNINYKMNTLKENQSAITGLVRGFGGLLLLVLLFIGICHLSLVLPLPLFQGSHPGFQDSCITGLESLVIFWTDLSFKSSVLFFNKSCPSLQL